MNTKYHTVAYMMKAGTGSVVLAVQWLERKRERERIRTMAEIQEFVSSRIWKHAERTRKKREVERNME